MADPAAGCSFCSTTSAVHDDECAIAHDSPERTAARLLADDGRLAERDDVVQVWTDHKKWMPAPEWLSIAVTALLTNGEIAELASMNREEIVRG